MFLLPDITAGLRPPSVFFVHSESMAEQENVSALESFDNPGPSTRETSMEGKNPSSTELVQAIVADQGFITQLS